MSNYHIPVLLKQSVDGLNIDPEGIYVDVTFGGGGHAREILKRLKGGRLVGFDQDPEAAKNIPDDDRFLLVRQNFSYLWNNLKYLGIDKVDGLIADLGVSSYQFDSAQRGFSFRMTGEMDMRMNPDAEFSALDLIGSYSEQEMTGVFSAYGEIKNARTLSRLIVAKRELKALHRIEDFVDAIKECTPSYNEYKYLAKVFQAIRIEVNKELSGLQILLEQTVDVIRRGGRLVVLSYHSLEDRMVKNFVKYGNFEKNMETDFYGNQKTPFKAINRKVILPDASEITENSRARSAKLRIAERRI
ncbi:MAG: 16S rRNA (cytosine(1402)-N(4))-methyltransferase RsmH [Bacteroidota bacterium]|nr:16S rRNA (cytosine(1402)-N(4))-methyltransferase RsmH [Bacteroidota bacterium]